MHKATSMHILSMSRFSGEYTEHQNKFKKKKKQPEIQLGTSHLSVDAQNGRSWTPSTGGDTASEVAEGQWGEFPFLAAFFTASVVLWPC